MNFNLPYLSEELTRRLRQQFRNQSWLYKFTQVVVGGILPIIESIVVNQATDNNNSSSQYFWVILLLLGIIHLSLLVLVLGIEIPLSQFLVEFDKQTRELEEAERELEEAEDVGSGQEFFLSTFQQALIAAQLSLLVILLKVEQSTDKLETVLAEVLEPWNTNRTRIFWFDEGNALSSMAVYLWDSQANALVVKSRLCDDRIKRTDRSWIPGEGEVGKCFQLRRTIFEEDVSKIITASEAYTREEDEFYYRSLIAQPIRGNGNRVVGVFVFTSSEPEQFDEEIHVLIVRIITQLIGVVLTLTAEK